MGLLNGLGMVAAGAGEGYGKGTAAVGAATLDSLLKDAQMMKEDNLARLRQGDQNTFNASQAQLEREARAAADKDTRQFQTDLKGIEFEEEGKRAKEKREHDAEQARLERESREREGAKSRASTERLAREKGETKGADNSFKDIPKGLEKNFMLQKYDRDGNPVVDPLTGPVMEWDTEAYEAFNSYWQQSGEPDPRKAYAVFKKRPEVPPMSFTFPSQNFGNQGGGLLGKTAPQSAQPQGVRKKHKTLGWGTYNESTGEFYPDSKP